jgi:hypothetical protein
MSCLTEPQFLCCSPANRREANSMPCRQATVSCGMPGLDNARLDVHM